jgi:DNA-binding transcriptional LysR family regulator
MVLVASAEYLEAHGVPGSYDDLRLHKLIARKFLSGAVSKWAFKLPDGDIYAFEPNNAVLTLSAPEAVVQAALDGVGVAQAAVHHAWPHLLSGRLKVVLANYHHAGSYEMALQYPHRALLAPRVRVVIEHLLITFSEDSLLHISLDRLRQYGA